MKQYSYRNRKEYLRTQIERSQAKMDYCKVFFSDVFRYRRMLLDDFKKRGINDPRSEIRSILCLGVRSGAEVDMFRAAFFSRLLGNSVFQEWVVGRDTSKMASEKIRLSRRYGKGAGRSSDGRVMGVEVNPDALREDVWVGSFDEMPTEWTDRFDLLYTNSFDHSQNAEKTVREWKRVAAPGAYLILVFPLENKPSSTDPLGGLEISTLKQLWQSDIVFASETMNLNGYHEICFRL